MTRCGPAAILCALCLLACEPGSGANSELSWAACRDGIDNDLDGLTDCADSDCRAIPCLDAGGPDASTSTDAQTHDAPDAAQETCDPACVTGEVCRDHECVIPLPAELRIEILSMDGPSAGSTLVPTCLDFAGGDCALFTPCNCPPDPYVRVDVEEPRPGGGLPIVTTVARTLPRRDTEIANWSDEDRWDLDLNPTLLQPRSTLVLVAVDSDSNREAAPDDTQDDLIFECVVQASALRMGSQRCVITPSNPLQSTKSEFEIWFEVRLP